jgi:hypothetical protein
MPCQTGGWKWSQSALLVAEQPVAYRSQAEKLACFAFDVDEVPQNEDSRGALMMGRGQVDSAKVDMAQTPGLRDHVESGEDQMSTQTTVSRRAAAGALAKIEARIRSLLRGAEDHAWQVGRLVDKIATEQLHVAAGHTSLDQYLDGRFSQGYSTLRRFRRVALAFERDTVRKHGATKLDAGLRYLSATKGKAAPPTDVLAMTVRVPTDGASKQLATVAFRDATPTQLEAAIAAARARPEPHDEETLRAAKRIQSQVQVAVAAPEGTYRHAPLVRVKPHPTNAGQVRIDLLGIDGDDLDRIAEALLPLGAVTRGAGVSLQKKAKRTPDRRRGAH